MSTYVTLYSFDSNDLIKATKFLKNFLYASVSRTYFLFNFSFVRGKKTKKNVQQINANIHTGVQR